MPVECNRGGCVVFLFSPRYADVFCYMSERSSFFSAWHLLIIENFICTRVLHCKSSHQINILVLYIFFGIIFLHKLDSKRSLGS
jgi:hypothetical protein